MKQKVLRLIPFLIVLLLAGFVYATQCSWDVLNDDFDDNSSGWVQSQVAGLCPNTTFNMTISSGTMKINQTYDSATCYYEAAANGDVRGNAHNATLSFRWRFKYLTDVAVNDDDGFHVDAINSVRFRYTRENYIVIRDDSPTLYPILNENATNNTWTAWEVWTIKYLDTSSEALLYRNDVFIANVSGTAEAGAAQSINLGRIAGRFGDVSGSWGAIELDYFRVDNSSCGLCDEDDDCDYGDYCNDAGFCENTTECDIDDDCFGLYGFGYFCNDDNHCSLEGFCDVDAECQTNEYCDTYTASFYHTCRDKLNISEACTHDNQCFEAECVNETPSVTICNPLEPNECWPTGLCELDNTCWTYGTCYNATASNYCTQDSNCTATEYCSVQTENDSFGACETKNKLAWDSCERDRWCDNTTNNTYAEALSCDNNFCTPDSWECNWVGAGCGAGLACNWSVITRVGDHLCVNGTVGQECDEDADCASGNCLAGVCVATTTECLYTNPNVLGEPNPFQPSEGYCDSDPSTETNKWCYVDALSYTWTAADGGGIPIAPDNVCYPKFDLGWDCDFHYQCYSLNCEFSGNTSTKTCNPIDGGTIEDSTVTVSLDNCEPSSNGLGWDCPVDGTAVVFARYRDENSNHIPDAEFCRAYSNAFDVSNPTLTEGATAYSAPVSFGVNTNINYTLIVECRKSGFGVTFSDTVYIYLKDINTTYITWVEPRNNTEFKAGKAVDFRVRFRDITGAELNAGSCTLTLDGSDYGMANPYGGIYVAHDINVPTISGGYAYTVTCTKSDFVSATSPEQSLTVLQGHCFNDYKDGDETGKDCGGSCKPCGEPPNPDDCFNDEYDNCEWGVDCGGCCDKECVWSDCFNGIQDGMEWGVDCGGFCAMDCEDGSCSNGIKDGDEKGIDCGGRCYLMDDVEGACFCDYTNDCDPSDGSWYCDYTVSDVSGVCLESVCDENSDCPDVQWDYGGLAANRSRVCDLNSGWCKWGSENYTNGSTAEIVLDIQPLSGLPVYNKTYVGSCEYLTHGFRIATNRATKKAYYFIAHPNADSIPADSIISSYPFKDFDLGRLTNLSLSTIPKLCRSMTGESIYARIVFKATEPTTGKFNADVVDIQVYAFRFAANVSLSGDDADVADFNLTRSGECFVRTNEFSNWTNISAAASTAHSYDFSSIASMTFFWLCNTTQGESDGGRFNAGGVGIVFDLLKGVFMGLTGGSFEWFGWMGWLLLPLFIVISLLYLAVRDRQKGNNGR